MENRHIPPPKDISGTQASTSSPDLEDSGRGVSLAHCFGRFYWGSYFLDDSSGTFCRYSAGKFDILIGNGRLSFGQTKAIDVIWGYYACGPRGKCYPGMTHVHRFLGCSIATYGDFDSSIHFIYYRCIVHYRYFNLSGRTQNPLWPTEGGDFR